MLRLSQTGSDVKGVGVVRSRATVDVKMCDTPPRVPSRTREVRVDREYTRTRRGVSRIWSYVRGLKELIPRLGHRHAASE